MKGKYPGAYPWKWKDMLWETHMRDFPSPREFARRLAAAGIDNDNTVVFYGEGVQFGIYAWRVFRYCGHEKVLYLALTQILGFDNVRVYDGSWTEWG